jgi:hypothetical protein
MKKFILLVVFTGFVNFTSQAQTLKYGAFVGLNISKMSFGEGAIKIKGDAFAGPKIGAFLEYEISDQIGIVGLPGISVKGTKFVGSKMSFTYLDIPVYAVYKYKVGPGKAFGGLGPYFGIALLGRSDGEKIDFGDGGAQRGDFGFNFVLGYEFSDLGLKTLLTVSPGIGNISGDSDMKIRNFTFGIGAAYILNR